MDDAIIKFSYQNTNKINRFVESNEQIFHEIFAPTNVLDLTFDKFCYRISKYSEIIFPNKSDYIDVSIIDKQNKFKGDIFEIFTEYLLRKRAGTEAASLNEYSPFSSEEDLGVDGTGMHVNNYMVAVQAKFRSNPKDLITYTDMAKTVNQALNIGINPLLHQSIWCITSASGVSDQCLKGIKGLYLINREHLNKITKSPSFWEGLYNSTFKAVQDTLI